MQTKWMKLDLAATLEQLFWLRLLFSRATVSNIGLKINRPTCYVVRNQCVIVMVTRYDVSDDRTQYLFQRGTTCCCMISL